jgi:hypothetical protein
MFCLQVRLETKILSVIPNIFAPHLFWSVTAAADIIRHESAVITSCFSHTEIHLQDAFVFECPYVEFQF